MGMPIFSNRSYPRTSIVLLLVRKYNLKKENTVKDAECSRLDYI